MVRVRKAPLQIVERRVRLSSACLIEHCGDKIGSGNTLGLSCQPTTYNARTTRYIENLILGIDLDGVFKQLQRVFGGVRKNGRKGLCLSSELVNDQSVVCCFHIVHD